MTNYAQIWDSTPAAPSAGTQVLTQTAPAGSPNYAAIWNSVPAAQPQRVQAQTQEPPSTIQNIASAVGSTPQGSAALGAGKGLLDTLVLGPAQLITRGVEAVYPKSWPGADLIQGTAEQQQADIDAINRGYQAATQEHPSAATAGNIAGSVGALAALPVGDVGEGANLFNKAIYAAKVGGIAGLAQPVTQEGNFWLNKAGQGTTGAVGGLVGYPVGAAAGKALGWAGGKALGLVSPAVRGEVEADMGNPDMSPMAREAVTAVSKKDPELGQKVANASPELQQSIINTAQSPTQELSLKALKNQLIADKFGGRLTPGQANEDPAQISNERNLRSAAGNEAMVQHLNAQNGHLVAGIGKLQKTVAPDIDATDNFDASQNVINAIQQRVNQQKAQTTSLYKMLADANGGDLPMDGASFAKESEAALKKQMKGAFLPAEFKGILDGFKSGEEPMTFENFENLRTMLGAAQRKAARSGDGNAEGAINIVRNKLENMPVDSDVAGVKELADQARASAKQGFDLERQIPAYKAVSNGDAEPDNFARKYILGGSKQDLSNLAGLLKDDPQALQQIKLMPVNHLGDKSVNSTGLFSQARYNNTLKSLGPKLDTLYSPQEISDLKDLGEFGRLVQQRPAGSYVNESNTDVAALARGAGGAAARAVDAATHSPVGSVIASQIEKQAEKRAAQKTLRGVLSPGAGISVPSQTQRTLSGVVPNLTGKTGSLALGALLAQPNRKRGTK